MITAIKLSDNLGSIVLNREQSLILARCLAVESFITSPTVFSSFYLAPKWHCTPATSHSDQSCSNHCRWGTRAPLINVRLARRGRSPWKLWPLHTSLQLSRQMALVNGLLRIYSAQFTQCSISTFNYHILKLSRDEWWPETPNLFKSKLSRAPGSSTLINPFQLSHWNYVNWSMMMPIIFDWKK